VSAEEPNDVARLREALASIESDGIREPVDAARIFDALHGDLSPEERYAVIEQLVRDPAAAAAWRLAREMAPDTAPRAAVNRGPETPRRSARLRWIAVAAAAMLAVAVAQWLPRRAADEPVYRNVESRAIASALPPGAELSRARPVLRWTGVDGARYRVRVLTSDLQLLDESTETSGREYTVAPEALARIPPGGHLLWQVEARIPGEGMVASPTFTVRVP
jgi:hypothetical protein